MTTQQLWLCLDWIMTVDNAPLRDFTFCHLCQSGSAWDSFDYKATQATMHSFVAPLESIRFLASCFAATQMSFTNQSLWGCNTTVRVYGVQTFSTSYECWQQCISVHMTYTCVRVHTNIRIYISHVVKIKSDAYTIHMPKYTYQHKHAHITCGERPTWRAELGRPESSPR